MSIVKGRPRVVMISQARMGSTRLPGKCLKDICGKPLLQHHLERLGRCRLVDRLVLATTDQAHDDPLVALAAALGVAVFRGSEHDVLDRYVRCARVHDAEVIVRVTGDCPLIDPQLSDAVIAAFLNAEPVLDYLSLAIRPFPRGLDTEVFTLDALLCADAETADPYHREHVTSFLYGTPDRFRTDSYADAEDCGEVRWCVDDLGDLHLVRRLFEALLPGKPEFGWRECLEAMRRFRE